MDKRDLLRLQEAAERCGVQPEVIERFIAFAWVQPSDPEQMLLDQADLSRSRLIWQLQEDLGVNDEGIDVILGLVDQLHRLHRELRGAR